MSFFLKYYKWIDAKDIKGLMTHCEEVGIGNLDSLFKLSEKIMEVLSNRAKKATQKNS